MWRDGVSLDELERLYRERYDHLARVAMVIAGDPEAGRDAVQTAFAVAVRKRRAFRGSGPLEAWVWRIAVNEARRARRRPRRAPIVEAEPATNGDRPDDDVRAWISALPERQRAAVFLRYYADLDYRTIAGVLGVEVGTVSATLNAAHTTLRRMLAEVER